MTDTKKVEAVTRWLRKELGRPVDDIPAIEAILILLEPVREALIVSRDVIGGQISDVREMVAGEEIDEALTALSKIMGEEKK